MEYFESRIVIVNQCNKFIEVYYESTLGASTKLHLCTIDLNKDKVIVHCKKSEHSKLIATVIKLVSDAIVENIGVK